MEENNCVFMSIKDEHINKIVNKTKNHEFRTKTPKAKFDYIIVYIPVPIKQIKYILKVKEPVISPNKIAEIGLGNDKFNKETSTKFAYPIENLFEINQSIGLDELKKKYKFTAPQFFAYGKKYNELIEYINKIGFKKIY